MTVFQIHMKETEADFDFKDIVSLLESCVLEWLLKHESKIGSNKICKVVQQNEDSDLYILLVATCTSDSRFKCLVCLIAMILKAEINVKQINK